MRTLIFIAAILSASTANAQLPQLLDNPTFDLSLSPGIVASYFDQEGPFLPPGETVSAFTTTQASLTLTGDGVVPDRLRGIQDGVPMLLDIDAFLTQSLRTTQHFDDRFLGVQTVPGYPLVSNTEVIDMEPVELVYHFSEVDSDGMITATAKPLVWEFEIDLGLGYRHRRHGPHVPATNSRV